MLQAIGSAVGNAVGSLVGSNQERVRQKRWRENQRRYDEAHFDRLAAAREKHGLSWQAILGAAPQNNVMGYQSAGAPNIQIPQKATAAQKRLAQLQLEGLELDNRHKRIQNELLLNQLAPEPEPNRGASLSINTHPGGPGSLQGGHVAPDILRDVQYVRTHNGHVVVPGPEIRDFVQESPVAAVAWYARNSHLIWDSAKQRGDSQKSAEAQVWELLTGTPYSSKTKSPTLLELKAKIREDAREEFNRRNPNAHRKVY